MSKILVTGAAGFIGFHTARRLLARGDAVVGLDNVNDYYSVQLKFDRLAQLQAEPGFRFVKLDLADGPAIAQLFEEERFDLVVNLAAQAGVRYSLENPGGLRQQQPGRLYEHPGGLPACGRQTPGLCLFEFRLRGQHANAFLGSSERRPSREPVRGHEKGQRADGPYL